MAVVIDGTSGITSPAESVSGNLTFTGTGNRITGDFSNATIANRVMFQSSTTNGATEVTAIPNGTSVSGNVAALNNTDPTNAGRIRIGLTDTISYLDSGRVGTGTYLPMTFYTGGAERMRIDSSGNLLVGTTTSAGQLTLQKAYGGGIAISINTTNTGTAFTAAIFKQGGTTVGFINANSASTSYNTTSDYRLKESIAPMTGALAKVALLKPCTYKWKSDGSDGQGFIAHELAEVEAGCVTGEKDAVDAEGNPQYQGIDTSFLVATLTAAIQEQQALIVSLQDTLTALNERLTALEAPIV